MKSLHYIQLLAITMILAAGCRKNDLQTNVTPITVVVKANYSEKISSDFTLKDIKVTLKNTMNRTELTEPTDKNGISVFSNIASGVYEVKATIEVDKATYERITGHTIQTETGTLNGSLPARSLNPSSNNSLEMQLDMGKIGEWVFKQIYYAGSNGTNGASFRDQFIEIYNNTDEVLYADSLYFGALTGNNTKFTIVDLSKGYFLDNDSYELHKQFNWGMSIGMVPADANAYKNFVYMKSLFRIPGNGKTYPVQPGASIVIAATALNHKAPYVGTDNKPVNIKDPSLTIDLQNADFEVYLGNVVPNPFGSDIDNLNVPNMVVIEPDNRDLILDATGRDAYVIFKTDKAIPVFGSTDPKGYQKYPDPSVKVVDASTTVFYQIPNSDIIDAVQIQNPNPTATARVARKLVNALDAGPVYVPDGQYSSQSLIRKTFKTVNGRRILMDTNNSLNDFDFFPLANPKGFKN